MPEITCPKCGAETTIRTSKRDGSKFHVCVNYPDCDGKVAFDDEWEEERPVSKATHERTQQRRVPKSNVAPTKRTLSPVRIIAGVVIGIIVLIIIVMVIPSNPDTSNHQDTSIATLPTPTPTSIYTATPTPVSSPVTVGNVAKWTVLEAQDKGQVLYGSEGPYPLFTEDKTTTGKFIAVTFIVENIGNQPILFISEPTIVDSQDREFSFMQGFANYVPEGMALGGDTLQPNIPYQSIVIYEVANDATGLKLQVNDFGYCPYCETALISLGF